MTSRRLWVASALGGTAGCERQLQRTSDRDLTAGGSYKIAKNDFMTAGGDGYPVFTSRATTQNIMDQVLADCVQANSPVAPAIQGRIVCTPSGPTACPVLTP